MEASERNARAQAMFPDDWARMEAMTGKNRQRLKATLRNRADYAAGLAALPEHATCGTCEHRKRHVLIGDHCVLDSDFHGYAKVKLDHRCPRWSARK